MIFDRVLLEVAVGHALLARVGPAERRLDAIARVVGEGEADGAGRRDRQQMRVAQAVRADAVLQGLRQARCEVVAAQKEIGVEQRKRTALARKLDRRVVGGVAQCLRDAPRHRERLRRVVAQPEHRERIAEPREAEAHAALAARFVVLLRQRPYRHVEHVVEHANGDAREILETRIVEARVLIQFLRRGNRCVRIGKLAPAGINLFVKIEAFNPLGSVKDRLALGVIEDAERSGAL